MTWDATFQLLFYSGYYCFVPERTVEGEGRMTRELELSPRHGSELVSVEYSLELANDKCIGCIDMLPRIYTDV